MPTVLIAFVVLGLALIAGVVVLQLNPRRTANAKQDVPDSTLEGLHTRAVRIGLALALMFDASFLLFSQFLAKDDTPSRAMLAELGVLVFVVSATAAVGYSVQRCGRTWTVSQIVTIWVFALCNALAVGLTAWNQILNTVNWF
ncbi:MAG: hypothetical protein AAF432_07315 [Planctomycetota bacterium]